MILLAFTLLGVDWDQHGRSVVWVAGVLIGLSVIWKYILWPLVHFGKLVNDYMEHQSKINKAVEVTLLSNNGGSTLKDKIEDTHALVQSLDVRVARLEKDQ